MLILSKSDVEPACLARTRKKLNPNSPTLKLDGGKLGAISSKSVKVTEKFSSIIASCSSLAWTRMV